MLLVFGTCHLIRLKINFAAFLDQISSLSQGLGQAVSRRYCLPKRMNRHIEGAAMVPIVTIFNLKYPASSHTES